MTLHTLLAASTATTVAAKSKSSGSSYGFVIIIVVFAAFYFLVLRPRSQRQRQARGQVTALEIGSAVMSVGGIKGVVVGMDDTDVQVEVSPGVVLTFIRKAVNAQTPPAAAPDEPTGVFHDDDLGHQDTSSDDTRHARFGPEDGGVEGGRGPVGFEEPDDRPGTGTEGR